MAIRSVADPYGFEADVIDALRNFSIEDCEVEVLLRLPLEVVSDPDHVKEAVRTEVNDRIRGIIMGHILKKHPTVELKETSQWNVLPDGTKYCVPEVLPIQVQNPHELEETKK